MVRRIYVEKKKPFDVKAHELKHELKSYLGIVTEDVRVFIRYDVEDISDKVFEEACRTVFSEPPVDILYHETLDIPAGARVFSVEFLPGQFDQRADSAVQCVQFLDEKEQPTIRTAVTYMIIGNISDADMEKIEGYCINPVDSRMTGLDKPETLQVKYDEPGDIKIFDGFTKMSEAELKELYDSLSLAMTFKDFLHIRNYYENEEKRDPSLTEIRVLDTYWSDHCRHTTFSTELKNVEFGEGAYRAVFERAFADYMATRADLFKDRPEKFPCLMDLGTIAARRLRKEGVLDDEEVSDEINACSIVVPVEMDYGDHKETEEWLVFFKNETHNHPTEIEPFGGAATCLGGAIRDPLSGRGYVYQAMRVTGAADPTVSVSETMKGKLPQKKLVRTAAAGYSSYGNQIGLATGYVKEIYHPDYVAKRMEIGAVMGAAPRKHVKRENSDPGDIIILLGGRTGRDGCGGATGSSKAHNVKSIDTCGAEVQKGNAPTERKIQRLFRRPEVTRLIKKCNDFGAGGVSVAIGELADGLTVDLDKVPKKYAGLDGTELAISESQERMAVVVSPADVKEFLGYAAEENLEAVEVAVVTKEPRLVLNWRGKDIVNLSRAFLDTNGAHQETDVYVEIPDVDANPRKGFMNKNVAAAVAAGDTAAAWKASLADLNECSQKGLVEMFDSSIGAGSVTMPYGGVTQLTETQSMIAKLPVMKGETDTVTMMAFGFDPYISSWSPYHGAVYAVTESVARITASGGDPARIRLTFQEYFRRMSEDPKRWSQPFAALLGAYEAQIRYKLPSIGGKDSMSGTFGDIDVPPTLVSFAVDIAKGKNVVTPELKKAGDKLVLFRIPMGDYDLPDYEGTMKAYGEIHKLIEKGVIAAAYVADARGCAPALSKMAFGNRLGVKLGDKADDAVLFGWNVGCIIAEIAAGHETEAENAAIEKVFIGEVTAEAVIEAKGVKINLSDALTAWKEPLNRVFATKASDGTESVDCPLYDAKDIYVCKNKVAKPKVFIPVFPGTNCEYDTAAAFERAGAETSVRIFRNRDAQDIRESVEAFAKEIAGAQIIMFPGGFSAGDEPDGSAKFFATAFRNEKIKEEVEKLLGERDGLALGICNGFQALIKLGLVPTGKIVGQDENSPTLTFNTINRHISKMAYIKVTSNKSPWLRKAQLGGVYCNPASHGEGRFVAPDAVLKALIENGQVATRYCSPDGTVSMDEEYNINGSFLSIEGITSPDGRVLGKMAHSERIGKGVAVNIYGRQDLKIFESGIEYFR